MNNPTQQQIKQARKESGLTQQEASKILGVSVKSWQSWEQGLRNMRPQMFELFLIKTGERK